MNKLGISDYWRNEGVLNNIDRKIAWPHWKKKKIKIYFTWYIKINPRRFKNLTLKWKTLNNSGEIHVDTRVRIY